MRLRNRLKSLLACVMSVVLAVGLVPLPAFAGDAQSQTSLEAFSPADTQTFTQAPTQTSIQTPVADNSSNPAQLAQNLGLEESAFGLARLTGALSESNASDNYALLDANGTLAFYYGTVPTSAPEGCTMYTGYSRAAYSTPESLPWYNERKQITSVVFDDSTAPSQAGGIGQIYNTHGYSYWFYDCSNLKTIENLDYLKISGLLTSVMGKSIWSGSAYKAMFAGCTSLESTINESQEEGVFDLSGMIPDKWKNQAVPINVEEMFENCSSLKTIDMSNWYLGGMDPVNNYIQIPANSMFRGCRSLNEIRFDDNTLALNEANAMFYGCNNLGAINLKGADFSLLTTASEMFKTCFSLTSLDFSSVRGFASLENASGMFAGCEELTTIEFADTNWGALVEVEDMFMYCSKLTSLDLSHFQFANVESMTSMFTSCFALRSVDFTPSQDPSNPGSLPSNKLTNVAYLFSHCSSLEHVDVSGWDTSNVTVMFSAFYNCTSIKSIDMTGWSTESVTYAPDMFAETAIEQFSCSASFNFAKVGETSLIPNSPSTEPYDGKWKIVGSDVTFSSSDLLSYRYEGTFIWNSPNCPFNVMYEANGGSGFMPVEYCAAGVPVTIASALPTEEEGFYLGGKHIDHWNTAPDDSGDRYDPETEMFLGSDYILYAIWAEGDPELSIDEGNLPTVVEDLSYNGEEQDLVYAPDSLPRGCMGVLYQIDGGEWSSEIPAAKDCPEDLSYEVGVRLVGIYNCKDYELSSAEGADGPALSVTFEKAALRAKGTGRINYGSVFNSLRDVDISYTGFQGSDDASVIDKSNFSVESDEYQGVTSPAGTYSIDLDGLESSNYDISYEDSILIVDKAPLTVTASSATIAFGIAYTPSVSYSGFVNGEGAGVLGGKLSFNMGGFVKGKSLASSYKITPGGLTSQNYAISFVPGTLNLSGIAKNASITLASQTYKATSANTVTLTAGKNAKNVTVAASVKIFGKAYKINAIGAKAFAKAKKAVKVTIGANVATIGKQAFKGATKAKTLILKTKLIKKAASVKGSLKDSKVKTIQVKIGTKKVNKTFIKKYKKFFTKKIAGVKVTVK